MATKSNSSKRNKKSPFAEAKQPVANTPPAGRPSEPTGPRWSLVILFVVIVFGGGFLAMVFKDARMWNFAMGEIEQYTYEEVRKHPHDPSAFTQGLFFHQGKFYESTGKYEGKSSMRRVNLETGEVEHQVVLGNEFFGEGATVLNDKIYQLTWKEGKCFVYDLNLKLINTFEYEGEGWGLCTDGTHLIMSDGTTKLLYVDPDDFSIVKKVFVSLGNRSVSRLNELEYFGGKIYANQLNSDSIYEINAKTGKVTAMIDLSGLWPTKDRPNGGVLNGIAYKKNEEAILHVTGKYCPFVYEIKFVPREN